MLYEEFKHDFTYIYRERVAEYFKFAPPKPGAAVDEPSGT